jgi:hypothetical protein
MEIWAVIFWVLTITGGLFMLGITLRAGKDGVTSNLPASVVMLHATLGVAGLGLYALALGYGEDSLMWTALGAALLTAGGGTFMFLRWLKDHHGSPEEVEANRARLAEQQIPSTVVHMHGAFAGLTIVAVLLVALGIG